jgi:predicted metal-dependent phosphoesterase TrpH
MHSTLSDGTLQVAEIVDVAARRKLTAIAITDHDNIDSWEQGKDLAAEAGVELIPGVEISSSWEGSDIHILGYFFDPSNLALNQALERSKRRRLLRAKAMVRKLDRLGLPIRFEKVLSYVQGGTVGRPHIARALLEEEYIKSFQEAFEKWLGPDCPAYVETESLTPMETIALVNNAGGAAVMAHPLHTNRDDLIPQLVEAGLKGIEIYTHRIPSAARRKYQDIAQRHNLVWTGGSDSHGERPGCPGIGSVRVAHTVVEKLLEARDRHFAEI